MSKHMENISLSWTMRQKKFGNTTRSVLFKNLPNWMNDSIHKRHSEFVLENLPKMTSDVLDVGCGYGRMAAEIKKKNPSIKIQGVELCKPFADKFISDYGNCFVGSVQEYTPSKKFDVIIIVTVLMYTEISEISSIITKLWHSLNKNGRLICIEPSTSFLIEARRLLRKKELQPTGENVHYFSKSEFLEVVEKNLNSSMFVANQSFGLFPIISKPVIHHGLVFEKI